MCLTRITDVSFYPVKPTQKGLIGFASCQFNNKLVLNSIAIYTRPSGARIRCVFPEKILPNGLKINVFHPTNDETRKNIEDAIDAKVQKVAKDFTESGD